MALVLEEEVWSKHFQSQVNTKWSPTDEKCDNNRDQNFCYFLMLVLLMIFYFPSCSILGGWPFSSCF